MTVRGEPCRAEISSVLGLHLRRCRVEALNMGQKGTGYASLEVKKFGLCSRTVSQLAVVDKDCARPCMGTLPVILAFSRLRQEEHMRTRTQEEGGGK